MPKYFILAALVLAIAAVALCEDVATTQAASSGGFVDPTPADTSKIAFVDTFQKDPKQNGWIESQNSIYAGQTWKWTTAPGAVTGLSGDKGLLAANEPQRFGIAHAVNVDNTDKDFVFQYEVKYERNIQCSGAYVKLLSKTEDLDLNNFDDKTPYVIMFGPDYCSPTDKVHFILRHFNPVAKKWEEKHMKNAPLIKNDHYSHLYTLIIRKDNSFEILIDNESARTGSLLTDFDPSINPPKEIDDPTDKKPANWVDEEFIDDVSAKKPDDWDEEAPLEIPDPEDKKPEGWQDDAPARIPDPEAKKPDDWNDDEDGKWEAPLVENPVCKEIGCGTWAPRMIRNKNYKGKWKAPQIPNPEFKGKWAPRKIANPDFYEDLHPHNFPIIGAVAFEIWAVQGSILFDNVMIAHDERVAKEFAKKTWAKKLDAQKLQTPTAPTDTSIAAIAEKVQEFIVKYPIPILVTSLAILVTIPFICCRLCCSGDDEVAAVVPPKTKPQGGEGAEAAANEDDAKETKEQATTPAEEQIEEVQTPAAAEIKKETLTKRTGRTRKD